MPYRPMENWDASCSGCREIPAFCVASSKVYPNPLTILSNGSQFLYLLDFNKEQKFAVLKFPEHVVHVSMMNSVCDSDTESAIVTCLAQGQILVFSLANIVNLVHKQSETSKDNSPAFSEDEDIFTFLLSHMKPPETICSRKGRTISSEKVCAGIAMCTQGWTLLSAVITNNDLLMCRRLRRTGEISVLMLRSHRTVEIPSVGMGTVTVPSYIGSSTIETMIISTRREGGVDLNNDPVSRVMDCRPAFLLIRSEKHFPRPFANFVDSELFLRIFGLEFELSKSPVLLIGCQNGNIYYTNFGCRRSSSSDKEKGSILFPLYSIEQPVIGIHLAYFPMNKTPEGDDLFHISTDESKQPQQRDTPNTIVFVGQGGKIALCHLGGDNPNRTYPSFTEFHVPSPVLSSILIPGVHLLYSTLQGLYSICLRQDCTDSVKKNHLALSGSANTIQIPEMGFRFPEKIYSSDACAYLLPTTTSYQCPEACSDEYSLKCSCLFSGGQIGSLRLDGHQVSLHKNSSAVGQEIKSCLESIQALGDEVDGITKKISSFNVVLSEVKTVMDVLCAVEETSSSSECPFSISFTTTHEKVGIGLKALHIEVKLSYIMGEPLSNGWSLLVTSESHSHSKRMDSKFCSLDGMISGNSVVMRTSVESTELDLSVNSFIHYDPQHLCKFLSSEDSFHNAAMYKSVSLFLCKRDFTILDFLQDKKDTRETISSVQLRTIKSILSPEVSGDSSNQTASLLHSVNLSIPLNTIIQGSASSPEDIQGMSTEVLGSKLLSVLVPAIPTHKPKSRNPSAKKNAALYYSAFDESSVTFEVNRTDSTGGVTTEERCNVDTIRLTIRASSSEFLIRVMSGVRRKLEARSNCNAVPYTRDHLSPRVVALKCLLQEISRIQRELSSVHRERELNCVTSDTYSDKLDSLQTKIISILFKLRELS